MSNAISNAVSNVVQGSISSGLKKVAGGILGTSASRGRPISGMPWLNSGSKYTTKSLAYPLAVENDPQQGHYIMFNINAFKPAKIKITDSMKTSKVLEVDGIYSDDMGHDEDLKYTNTIPKNSAVTPVKSSKLGQQIKGADGKNLKGLNGGGMSAGSRSIYAEAYKSSKRLDTVISLYMPPTVSVNYQAKYNDSEIGLLSDTGLKAFKAFQNTGGGTMEKFAAAGGELSKGAGENLVRAAIKAGDGVLPGIKTLAQVEMGEIIGSHMELMFEGVGRRSFSFTFIFIPKSEKEAQTVDQIIKKFKYHMLPSYVGDSRRSMTIPDFFDITYMHKGGPNDFLNKISTCFLESANVTYGSDRFTAYEQTQTMDGGSGAPPQRTTLALNFRETEIMTREHVEQGF